MFKIIALAGGLVGGATFSQYPEFAQQYTQRLAGQVDALTIVVNDFEASAMRSGLTRTQAFEQMTGTQFLEDRQSDMRRTFKRHAVLTDNLAELRAASPLARLAMPQRLIDSEIFANTWDDFTPAVPLSVAGLVAAAGGGVLGWLASGALFALLMRGFRQKKRPSAAATSQRKEPALRRADVPQPQVGTKQPLVGRR